MSEAAISPSGVLNIDKPAGLTSHDVVARVRRLSGVRRVGHAGALDPLATGVLLVCVGAATRIVEYLQAGRKTYAVQVRLGQRTDTYDAQGQVLSQAPVPALDAAALEQALAPFRGPGWQIPPMVSALKHKGRALYEYARQGEEIARTPRAMTVHHLEITQWQPPDLDLLVVCSPGFYVRSLAHDLGEALGCGGHVRQLRRLASGAWRVEDAIPLAELEQAGPAWSDRLHSLKAALSMLPPLVLDDELAQRFVQGQRLPLPAGAVAGDVRVFGVDEQLLGIGRAEPEQGRLSPHKIFQPPAMINH
ncbi:MAG: tRNA pseudouridine(55) synthase TruB [Caldilineales bacterium]|nr:tRNA pseudouridine(55) synthase TruB [Caldilineales bacterium]